MAKTFYISVASLMLSFLLGTISQAAEPLPFSDQEYLKKCGGAIYSTCDSAELNQETIFLAAVDLAKNSNRKVIVDLGADWCHWCVYLDGMMANFPEQTKTLNRKYVIVKLNADLPSTEKLKTKYEFSNMGLPTMFIFDPILNKSTGSFIPSSMKTVSEILNKAENINSTKLTRYPWFPKSDVGSDPGKDKVRLSLLLKPIQVSSSHRSAVDQIFVNTGSTPEAEAYYQEGVFHLMTYNWVDAARALRKAVILAPNMASAYLALAQALGSLSDIDSTMGCLQQVQEIAQRTKLKPSEIAWLNFFRLELCGDDESCRNLGMKKTNSSWVETKNLYDNAMKTAGTLALAEGNLNGAVLSNLYNFDQAFHEDVLKKQSNLIGAHHLLIHIFESANNYSQAAEHARITAEMAPNSAHAQHMYGHILPKLNRWDDAIAQFEKADRIHEKWMASLGAFPQEDWHYRHNLDLLSHAYNWNHNFDKANKSWSKLCTLFGADYCQTYGLFLITRGEFEKASKTLDKAQKDTADKLTLQADVWMPVMADPNNAILRNKAFNAIPLNTKARMDQMIRTLLYPNLEAKIKKSVVDYVVANVKQAGFDSWSKGVMEGLVYAKFAESMGDVALAAEIRLAIRQLGFVCKSK